MKTKILIRVKTAETDEFVLKAISLLELNNMLHKEYIYVCRLNGVESEDISAFSKQIFRYCEGYPLLSINLKHIALMILQYEEMVAYSEILKYLNKNREYFVSLGTCYPKFYKNLMLP